MLGLAKWRVYFLSHTYTESHAAIQLSIILIGWMMLRKELILIIRTNEGASEKRLNNENQRSELETVVTVTFHNKWNAMETTKAHWNWTNEKSREKKTRKDI